MKKLTSQDIPEQKDKMPVCISDGPSSLVDFLAGSTIQVSLFKLERFSGIKKGSRSQNLYC